MISAGNNTILDSTTLKVSALPPLQIGDLTEVMVTQPGSLVTGTSTQYNFIFKLPMAIGASSAIIIKFPNRTISPDLSSIAATNPVSNLAYNCSEIVSEGPYITSITFAQFCQEATCDSVTL